MKNKTHLMLAALVFVLACLYLLPFVDVYRGGDEGLFLAGAQRLVRGETIYRDFHTFLTPGAFIFLASLYKLFGMHILVGRIATLIISALIVTLTYLLAEKLLKNRYLALLPGFMVLVVGFPDWYIYSHHWLSSLSALSAVYLIILGENSVGDSTGETSVWRQKTTYFFLLAGLSLAFTLICMQNKGVLIILGLAVYLLFFTRLRKSDRIAFALGTIGGLGILLIYLLAQGNLISFFYHTVVWPFTHYSRANAVPYFNLGTELLRESLAQQKYALTYFNFRSLLSLLFYSSESLFLLVLGYAPLAIPASFWAARALRKKDPASAEASLLYLFSLSSLALFLSSWHRPDIFHLIDIAPLYLILFLYFIQKGVEATRLFHRAEKPKIIRILPGTILVLAILMLVINTLARAEDYILKRYKYPHYAIDSDKGRQWSAGPRIAQDYNFLLPYLKDRLKPQEPFFALYQQSMVYFLSGAYNPTPIDHFYPEHDDPAILQGVLKIIQEKNIRYILKDRYQEDIIAGKYDSSYPHASFQALKNDPISRYVEENYQPALVLNHFTLYQRKNP